MMVMATVMSYMKILMKKHPITAESNHANHDLDHDEHVFHQLSINLGLLYVSAFSFL